jgi:CRP-like cAMP-binding protein
MTAAQSAAFLQLLDEGAEYSQVRAYAGDVLFTEKMAGSHLYLIKEGQVDLYLLREERRVVIDTLQKGQCFGMNSKLLNSGHTTNAMARTYSEFYVIDSASMDRQLKAAPQLVRTMLTTMASQNARASELIATKVNYQPDILVYAQLLQLMGAADVAVRGADMRARGEQPQTAALLLTELFAQARALLGHTKPHIRHIVGHLESLHLVHLEDDGSKGRRIVFLPKDIVARARKLAVADPHRDKFDDEYVSVDEFAEMVEVDRGTLLSKLARSEFSDDLFMFRKGEVVRLLDTKGRKFFAQRKMKSPDEFVDVLDLEFASNKALVEVLSKLDTLDIAKLFTTLDDDKLKAKIMTCLPRARREQVDSDADDLRNVDPFEVAQLGGALVKRVKEVMLGVVA